MHQQDTMSMQHLHDKQMHSLRSEWDHERTQLNKATKALEDVVKYNTATNTFPLSHHCIRTRLNGEISAKFKQKSKSNILWCILFTQIVPIFVVLIFLSRCM